MPPLAPLALRYFLWLVGLRILFVALVNLAGFPNSPATGVILAAAPAVDIGMQAMRRATRPLRLPEWARIWGVMMAIYLVFSLIIPVILVSGSRVVLADGAALGSLVLVTVSSGLMMALFLWIGVRASGRRHG